VITEFPLKIIFQSAERSIFMAKFSPKSESHSPLLEYMHHSVEVPSTCCFTPSYKSLIYSNTSKYIFNVIHIFNSSNNAKNIHLISLFSHAGKIIWSVLRAMHLKVNA
jgi:hypothetical protein